MRISDWSSDVCSSDLAQYATQEVERGDLTVTVSATGNLKPINQVDVGSEQSGLITDVYVDVNDRVTKGQVLARLDTSRLLATLNLRRAALAATDTCARAAPTPVAEPHTKPARAP